MLAHRIYLAQNLQICNYKVHNLPALHPDLVGVQFYILEGQYLAISKHGLYAAIPTEHDMRICVATKGHLCMLNHALYPADVSMPCTFLTDKESINTV